MVVGEDVSSGQHGLHVQRDLATGLGAGIGCRRGADLNGPEQGLARHAGPVGALAAHQLRLHQSYGQTSVRGVLGGVLPGGTGADHDDVPRFARPGHR